MLAGRLTGFRVDVIVSTLTGHDDPREDLYMSTHGQQIDYSVHSGLTEPILDHQKRLRAGAGNCKLYSCPSFVPSQGGRTCITRNAEGGTCNYYEFEHN